MKKLLFIVIFSCATTLLWAQEIPFRIAPTPTAWVADSLGNHRAVLSINSTGKIVKAVIPWRRRDKNPEEKNILVVDAQTNQRILNVNIADINRESGTIYFEPTSGVGKYYVYYMPYQVDGRSNYPNAKYLKRTSTADQAWLQTVKEAKDISTAKVKEFQSINELNSFYPMEVIATAEETKQLIEANQRTDYLVFPEDRMHPIKMTADLPQRWIINGVKNSFSDEAAKGENFAFQVGIYPITQNLENVKINFSDLKSQNGTTIPSNAISCINTNGTNWNGQPLTPNSA